MNGVEFTGAAENNMQPGGPSQQLLGVDAIREFNAPARYLRRGIWQAPRSTDRDRHAIRHERDTRLGLRVHAQQRFRRAQFLRRLIRSAFQRNQFGAAIGGPVRKNKTFIFANYEGFRQHLHQTGVDLVPDNNARNGYLPCAIVSPAPSPCPSSGLAFVGVTPLLALWPAPTPGAPDFGGIAEAFNSPLQTIRDDFATMRLDHSFNARDSFNAVYTIDDSNDFTPTSTNLYSTDVASLREQVLSAEETHVVSPTLLNTARVGFSRAGYFFTGEPTPGTAAANAARLHCRRSDRRRGCRRQRCFEPYGANQPGRQQQRQQPARCAQSLHL